MTVKLTEFCLTASFTKFSVYSVAMKDDCGRWLLANLLLELDEGERCISSWAAEGETYCDKHSQKS